MYLFTWAHCRISVPFVNSKEGFCCWATTIIIPVIITIITLPLEALAAVLTFRAALLPCSSFVLSNDECWLFGTQQFCFGCWPQDLTALQTHTSLWNCMIHWRWSSVPKYCYGALAITALAKPHRVSPQGDTKLSCRVRQWEIMDATEVDRLLVPTLIFLFPLNSLSNLICLVMLFRRYVSTSNLTLQ